MNLVGKKIHQRKKIFTEANVRKQQKEQCTQVYLYLCVYVQNFTPRERCIQV